MKKPKVKTKSKPIKYTALRQAIAEAEQDLKEEKGRLRVAYNDVEDFNAFDLLIDQARLAQEQQAYLHGLVKALELLYVVRPKTTTL